MDTMRESIERMMVEYLEQCGLNVNVVDIFDEFKIHFFLQLPEEPIW